MALLVHGILTMVGRGTLGLRQLPIIVPAVTNRIFLLDAFSPPSLAMVYSFHVVFTGYHAHSSIPSGFSFQSRGLRVGTS